MPTYNEINIQYENDHELFNGITKEEKIFVYLMMRASLPFNKINRDQNHRHSNEIIELFEYLYVNKKIIEWFDYTYNQKNTDETTLIKDIELYLIYLWTNHGIYFLKDQSKHKRTPKKLNLINLTEESLIVLLQNLNYTKPYKHLLRTIFNTDVDTEMFVSGDIEKSGNNYYEKGFTEVMYNQIPDKIKNKINVYFTTVPPYYIEHSVNAKYSEELTVTVYWLNKVLQHVKQYPMIFDEHTAKGIGYLINYLESGNEESFKQFSIEWLKGKNRVDYNMGFIEVYHDPKQLRGEASAEVTAKTTNMEQLNSVLLEIETRLPVPNEYKRIIDDSTVLNVSVNQQLFGAGNYGPMQITAAYCLPNDDGIRATHGSKQIIYKMMEPVKLNLDVWELLVKDDKIYSDIWDLQVLLHESLGHASGKLSFYIGKSGEKIRVIPDDLPHLIGKEYSALEELRAEIISLYISITEIDVLNQNGMYKGWYKQLGPDKLKDYCIMEMTRHFFRRLISQEDNFTEINGAHARANTIITNYLLDGGGIKITDDVKNIDNEEFHIVGIEVIDFNKVFSRVVKLLQLVQEIKSTANRHKCDELFYKYTAYPITIEMANEYRKYVIQIQKKLNGSIKSTAKLYSNFQPIVVGNQLVNVIIGEEQDVFEQQMHYSQLMLSTRYF